MGLQPRQVLKPPTSLFGKEKDFARGAVHQTDLSTAPTTVYTVSVSSFASQFLVKAAIYWLHLNTTQVSFFSRAPLAMTFN